MTIVVALLSMRRDAGRPRGPAVDRDRLHPGYGAAGGRRGTILLQRLMLDLYIKGRNSTFAGRNALGLGRRLDFLLEFGRLNHRMHNKLFVVEPDFQPENSWRVVLDADGKTVAWLTRGTAQTREHRPPETSLWRRFAARVIGALPIRGQLRVVGAVVAERESRTPVLVGRRTLAIERRRLHSRHCEPTSAARLLV